jgi:serine/threonine-protein kinase
LRAGTRLGERYRLEQRIGAGGMGEVWRAADELLGRTVAVKAMLPSVAGDPEFGRRFLAEATSMARVGHRSVAAVHDFGRGDGFAYLVMEFVDGESLAQRLGRVGRLDAVETMRVVAEAADGLRAVHAQGIVHRDVKPANILLRRDGSVVLTDFGIARHESAGQLTASGAILGTPSYLSPEQVLGRPATPLSDIYSLGLTAYECLAGEKPFVGDNPYAVALQRLQSAPRTIGLTLPAAVLLVVERALATDPAQRWPSAAALADAARGNRAGIAPPPTAPPAAAPLHTAPPHTGPGRRAALVAAGVVAVLVVAFEAWLLARAEPRTAPRTEAAGASTPAAAGAPTPAASPAGLPVGFVACGRQLCPAEPMCWAGLTEVSGKAFSPRQVDCTADHYWETFAAIAFPAGAEQVPPDDLMKQADIAAACSADVLAARSRSPIRTKSWRRQAWPIDQPGSGGTLLHCLAGSPDGESRAAMVR